MSRPVVVVTRKLPAEVEAELQKDFEARLNADDSPLTPGQLQEALRTADALLPTVTDKFTAEVLATEPLRAKLLANFGVGFNHIDVNAAKARGLSVSNTPDVLTDATADIAMILLLTVARRTGEGERHVRAGQWTGWRPTHMIGTQVSGKTLGLIGMGRIARAVARRAHHGFGMKVLFHDPFPPSPQEAAALGAEGLASLDEVLARSDFVSLHCPATPETRHLMSAERFGRMRKTAFLINTARGDVVDEAALVAALQSGQIAGAALDVFEREPVVTPALLTMENVVLLPHLGSATRETRAAMGMRALENLRLFFSGKPLRDRVV
ncbi:MAG: 2-hydroxyacid dehydrogenase [Gemmatimonadetes bacterium]|nr:2-hydroxyacid dehydrogenase [Gemmatimonadota bacterium]